jgi:hypothetical protein
MNPSQRRLNPLASPITTESEILVQPPKNHATFVDNMRLPVHRWFRFSAGYSALWARDLIAEHAQHVAEAYVLDPFVGSGTTLIAADEAGVRSHGFEAQPIVHRVCRAKLSWNVKVKAFLDAAHEVVQRAKRVRTEEEPNDLVLRCFSPRATGELFHLRRAMQDFDTERPLDDLLWLCFVSIVRRCSHVGTAPWQYVLPSRQKAVIPDSPIEEFSNQAATMAEDMRTMQRKAKKRSNVELLDARQGSTSRFRDFSLVLTSPPYANNYDYADATRVELSVLGLIDDWGGLKEYRKNLIPSCTQHVSSMGVPLERLLDDPLLQPIQTEIDEVCHTLTKVKESKGGKKQYDQMVAAYFAGMAGHWGELSKILRPGAELCYVVGDSAPYGVYVPTDKWLASVAEPFGFRFIRFEKSRDRNTKWKNRKHRVPLKEGNLWLVFDE